MVARDLRALLSRGCGCGRGRRRGRGDGGGDGGDGPGSPEVVMACLVWWVFSTSSYIIFVNYYQNQIYSVDHNALFGEYFDSSIESKTDSSMSISTLILSK